MKKLLSVILCLFSILTIFCTCFISSSANNDTDFQTIAIFKLDGAETQSGTVEMNIKNKKTNEIYTINIYGKDNWTAEKAIPAGEYEIKTLKTTEGMASLSLVKSSGKKFIIDNVSYTEVIIPVTEFVHLTTASDFLKNNFIVLILIASSAVGLLVIKSKREKGEG